MEDKVALNRKDEKTKWQLTGFFEVFDEVRLCRKATKQLVGHEPSFLCAEESRLFLLRLVHCIINITGKILIRKKGALIIIKL